MLDGLYTQYVCVYLSVLVEMATIPSGHCSEANPEAYSKVSYDNGVRWKRDWYE